MPRRAIRKNGHRFHRYKMKTPWSYITATIADPRSEEDFPFSRRATRYGGVWWELVEESSGQRAPQYGFPCLILQAQHVHSPIRREGSGKSSIIASEILFAFENDSEVNHRVP
jgi:hypothetical protein